LIRLKWFDGFSSPQATQLARNSIDKSIKKI